MSWNFPVNTNISESLLVETTNATAKELLKLDNNSVAVDNNSSYGCTLRLVARKSDGTANALFVRNFLIENTSGTTALVGSVITIGSDIGSNSGSPPVGWGVTVSADDTNDTIKIEVTGDASSTVRWIGRLEMVKIVE